MDTFEIVLWGLLTLGFVIFTHELGHFLAARIAGVRVDVFSIGVGPRLFGIVYKGTDYRVSAIPLGGYVLLYGEDAEGGTAEANAEIMNAKDAFCNAQLWKRAFIIIAGVAMNVIVAWVMTVCFLWSGFKAPAFTVDAMLSKIQAVAPDSPASRNGLKEGDIILKINNHPLTGWSSKKIDMALCDDTFCTAESKATFTVKRGSDIFTVVLEGELSVITSDNVIMYSYGITPVIYKPQYIQSEVWYDAFWKSVEMIYAMFALNTDTIRKLSDGSVSTDAIASPIAIIVSGGEVARESLVSFFVLVIVISIGIVFMNLIPLPPLDGGQLLFLLIEWVKGSAVCPRIRTKILTAGTVLLATIMVYLMIKDALELFAK